MLEGKSKEKSRKKPPFDYITAKTVASHEGNSSTGESSSPSALFTKFGGSFFGAASGSPQKVVTNIRGFLSNKLPSNISIPSVPDTGKRFLHLRHHWRSYVLIYYFAIYAFLERKKYCINYTSVPSFLISFFFPEKYYKMMIFMEPSTFFFL